MCVTLLGARVPIQWQGDVFAIHDHAINIILLQCESSIPVILTLLDRPENIGERSMVLSPECFKRIRSAATKSINRSGQAWSTNGRIILCGEELNALNALVWSTPALAGKPDICAINVVNSFLPSVQHPSPWGGQVFNIFNKYIRLVSESGMQSCYMSWSRIMSSLVGTGPGLTPSGDDMLVGHLCGLHALKGVEFMQISNQRFARRRPSEILRDLRKDLPTQLANTTSLSASILSDALEGSFNKPLTEFCRALICYSSDNKINTCSIATLESSLNNLLSIGATSGRDACHGLLQTFRFFA
jgi:hypothetical protein